MPLFRVSLVIGDIGADSSELTRYYNVADYAAALTRSQSLAEAADQIILGQVQDVWIAQKADTALWSLKASPNAASEVKHGARFTYRTQGGFPTSFSVPTFDQEQFTDNFDNVVLSAPEIIAFLLAATNSGVDRRNDPLQTLKAAYEINGGKRNSS